MTDGVRVGMTLADTGSTLLYREEILLRDKLGRIVDRRETIGGVATDYHYLGNLTRVVRSGAPTIDYVIDG